MLFSQLQQRLSIGVTSLALILVSIFFSNLEGFKPFFALFNALLLTIALREYFFLCEKKGYQPYKNLAIGTACLYLGTLFLSLVYSFSEQLPNLVLLGALVGLFLYSSYQKNDKIVNSALTAFAWIYLTIPLCCALRINYFFSSPEIQDGRVWLVYALLVSKTNDIGGYFIGKWKGKHSLAPTISPNKTIEGSLGGVVLSLVVSMAFGLSSHFALTLWQSIWLSLIISALAQLGDLAESLLKRDAQVKDSSHIPGLGGVLDTVDSLVFSLPFVYLLLDMKMIGI